MSFIDKVGIDKYSPSETILTTYNSNGDPNLAAIGIRKQDDKRIKLKLFAGSQTYRNIKNMGAAAVNVVNDSVFLVKQGLQEIFPHKEEEYKIERAKKIDAPIISNANAVIEFLVEKKTEKQITDEIGTSNMIEVVGIVKNVEMKNPQPKPFKRTDLYLIESAVMATKAIEAKKKGKENISKNFIDEIKSLKEKCENIAPDSREMKTILEILNYFNHN